ncbi:MAG TPA: CBS domain-containing protein [Candidatus Saccharimonadales bacterium]|nr:CBS domain-containing protein [Candidatus Saccharimonadales bacterium]
MMSFVVITLGLLVLLLSAIAEVFETVPAIELKRRARYGDKAATRLYKAARWGLATQWLLWFLIIVSSSFFFTLVSKHSPLWVAFGASIALIWIGFIWIPRSGARAINSYITELVAPLIGSLAHYVHGLTKHFGSAEHHYRVKHAKIYEKTDLLNLLTRQPDQPGNRISTIEINMLSHVLKFNDKLVADIMMSSTKVKEVSSDDRLGPIVLAELHKSGQRSFPVYQKKHINIVGTLELDEVISSSESPTVGEVMNPKLTFVHEEQPLTEVLQAISKTKAKLMIVINSFEDYVGVISAAQVLDELVGDVIADDFDLYDDKQAVVNRRIKPKDSDKEEITEEPEVIE